MPSERHSRLCTNCVTPPFDSRTFAFTVADLPALPYSSAMSDLDQIMFPTLKLKKPSTKEIEKALADGLSKLIGSEGVFATNISSMEWHSTDLKISLTVRPAFLDHESEEANQVEQPTSAEVVE
jgi:hypothetical protein